MFSKRGFIPQFYDQLFSQMAKNLKAKEPINDNRQYIQQVKRT